MRKKAKTEKHCPNCDLYDSAAQAWEAHAKRLWKEIDELEEKIEQMKDRKKHAEEISKTDQVILRQLGVRW